MLAIALCVRALLPILGLAHSYSTKIFFAPDTLSYLEPAREIVSHHRFFADGAPEIIRTPGYPLLLTVGIVAGHLVLVTVTLQILLSCLTVYIVYCTAHLLFRSERVAITAAALCAVEPLSILYASGLISETLFSVLTASAVYFLLKYLEYQQLGNLIVGGILFAASVYVRPIALFLPSVIAVGLLVCAILKSEKRTRRIIHVGVFMAISMLSVGFWEIRNQFEACFSGFSGISSINLYFYSAASVMAKREHVQFAALQKQMGFGDEQVYLARHPEQRTWNTAQRLEYMRSVAIHILSAHPFMYLRIHAAGMLRVLLDPGATVYLKFFRLYPESGGLLADVVDSPLKSATMNLMVKRPLLFWSNAVMMPLDLFYLVCASGVLVSRRLIREPMIIAVLLVVSYYVVMSGGPTGIARFRQPVMAMICVLASYGFHQILEQLQLRARDRGCG